MKFVTEKDKKLLLKQFSTKKGKTVNEAIDSIYNKELKKNGAEWIVVNRQWRFFVHLNKLPAQMKREGLIKEVGVKAGTAGRPEKVWQIVK